METLEGMKRTHHCGDLRKTEVGQEVVVCGWVSRRRDHGGLDVPSFRWTRCLWWYPVRRVPPDSRFVVRCIPSDVVTKKLKFTCYASKEGGAMEEIRFEVQGSADQPYGVVFARRDPGNLPAYCSCPAGEKGARGG